MRSDIYQRLPLPARQLVDKIESASAIDIEVRAKGDRPAGENVVEALGEQVVGVIVGPRSIVIESPTTIGDITIDAYFQELLHLERTFVQRVEQVYPRKASDNSNAANIENWLEHVVIIERQIALCPGLQERLDAELVTFWQACPWGASGIMLRFNLLTRYMITQRYG